MTPNLLILGGTTEATALCKALAEREMRAQVSLAGRVERPVRQPLPMRSGGFGGVEGLARFLKAEAISHVIDATHPFAARMSANAVAACAETGTPLVALTRPAWQRKAGDDWQSVPDIPAAAEALAGPARRILLAVGRMHLADFAPNPQHFYLLRLVDPPKERPPFPDHVALVSRGPFTEEGDRALMRAHRIDLVVSKNSGGQGAYAKIAAARSLGLPVVMIDRPEIPARHEVSEVAAVLDWLDHAGTDLGV
ncbi:cobalt-precorrin-6A reductase [Sulfitobacter sp. D35]|uniref:cobalt-precorrin-6A reductase n=1 Tax=Sulfitobacter sp. D35 TaxID=3083252 RepID=UPI00296FFF91|nr:cobalt-precorrin-6A reductase [Sulfitobacter sp. D35]MDW4496477.1 cobalt-precorrin-6A reductase [Sulfitobacter sp. D35]